MATLADLVIQTQSDVVDLLPLVEQVAAIKTELDALKLAVAAIPTTGGMAVDLTPLTTLVQSVSAQLQPTPSNPPVGGS